MKMDENAVDVQNTIETLDKLPDQTPQGDRPRSETAKKPTPKQKKSDR